MLIVYGLALVMPLALAAFAAPREESFWRELCIGTGIVAFAMLLLQFVLSGRIKVLSRWAGIDLMMRWHQLAARTLATLVIIHPLLLIVSSGPKDLASALEQLGTILMAPAYASGVLAWFLVLALVVAGLLRRRLPVPYEVWRLVHAAGGVIAGGLTAQHAFGVGLYSGLRAVAGYWCLLLVIATGIILFVYLARPLILRATPYRIRSRTEVGEGIWEIAVEQAGGAPFRFTAGQFAWFSFGRFPWPGFDHPFSIASSPAELPAVRILVKELGDFTRTIGQLPVGTSAYIDGPYGHFTLAERDADSLCLIAGGIGIAPIIGILRDRRANGESRPIALILAARTASEFVHRDEIDAMASSLDLRVTYVVENPPGGWQGPTGILDEPMVRSAVRCERPERCLVLMCGPTPMMLAVERHLAAVGVPPHRIIYERFVYD